MTIQENELIAARNSAHTVPGSITLREPQVKSRSLATGPGMIFFCLAAVMVLFWPTFRDLLFPGGNGGDYTHRIFVVPIFLSAVWRLRARLDALPIKTYWPGMIAVTGTGAFWLAGELTLIRLFTELAVVAMVPFVVLTIFGYRWLKALRFPLFFLLFSVPIRGPLVGMQVDLTAGFTHAALLTSGVAVHREGPYFELPSGKWSIAEACSGIEYLSACLMFSALFAWLMYRSNRKRTVFMIGAAIIAVSGNWLRAYLTILIAHLSDNRLLRDDHGTFGWILFALLLFIYCWIGLKYQDTGNEPSTAGSTVPANDRSTVVERSPAFGPALYVAPALVFAAMGAWPLIGQLLAYGNSIGPVEITSISPAGGWVKTGQTPITWRPALTNPSSESVQSFEKNGRHVDVFIGVFANQTWKSKLVTSVNNFVDSESSRWSLVGQGTSHVPFPEKLLPTRTGVVLGEGRRILARQWYWVHGVSTSNDMSAKLAQLRARLGGHGDVSAWVATYTIVENSQEAATDALDGFMREMALPIEQALRKTMQH